MCRRAAALDSERQAGSDPVDGHEHHLELVTVLGLDGGDRPTNPAGGGRGPGGAPGLDFCVLARHPRARAIPFEKLFWARRRLPLQEKNFLYGLYSFVVHLGDFTLCLSVFFCEYFFSGD